MTNKIKKEFSTKYDIWSANKPELQLAQALQGEDQDDQNLAMQILHDRYQQKLEHYLRKKLPLHLVSDIAQEVWVGFYTTARSNGVTTGVPNLLFTIAMHKCADALRSQYIERSIENDIPLKNDVSPAERAQVDRPIEAIFDTKEKQRFISEVPFTNLFSDCQRILWTLKYFMGYKTSTISRITDKKPQTIYSALSAARKRVRTHTLSEAYDLSFGNIERVGWLGMQIATKAETIIMDMPTNSIKPKLTPDELKAIDGLSPVSFSTKLVSNVWLSYELKEGQLVDSLLHCVLTSQKRWQEENLHMNRQASDQYENTLIFPADYWLAMLVDDEDIVLRDMVPLSNLTLKWNILETNAHQSIHPGHGDLEYVITHAPRKIMAAIQETTVI